MAKTRGDPAGIDRAQGVRAPLRAIEVRIGACKTFHAFVKNEAPLRRCDGASCVSAVTLHVLADELLQVALFIGLLVEPLEEIVLGGIETY